MTKAHVHAENMRLYAEDAAKTDTPWKLWEYSISGEAFSCLSANPTWNTVGTYRRKPAMVTVGRHSWPEPMKEEPSKGSIYWVTDIVVPDHPERCEWNCVGSHSSLNNGLCHTTREDAKVHAAALIAISKGDI